MLFIRKTLLVFILCICFIKTKAQSFNIDSLTQSLNTELHDTVRSAALDHLGHAYMRKGDMKTALDYTNKALDLAVKINYKRGIASAYNTLGNIYTELSDCAKAMEYHQKALTIRMELNDRKGIAASYNNIGIIYFNLSDFNKSIEYMQKAVKIQEELGNRYFFAAGIGNIAVLYDKLGEDSLALIYQKKSFEIHKEMGNKHDMVASLNQLGSLYRAKKEFGQAADYLKQALAIADSIDEVKGKAETHGNFGLLFFDMGKYTDAVTEFEKGLSISMQVSDKKVQTEQLTMLGNANMALKNNAAALQYYKTAYSVAAEIGSLEDQLNAASGMYKIYKENKDTKNALYYHEMLTQFKDSIYSTTKNAAFNNLKTQFALDRQEHELKSRSEEELKKKDGEEKQQRFISYIIIFILFIVLLFSYFLFQRFKITNSQKKIIEEQKVLVELKNKEVTDSIHYAKRIQQTLLAHDEFLSRNLPEHFIIYKPKDIVSGDFYWASAGADSDGIKGNKFFYLAVCDSTGHGVPGAFMSLLNISFLNEAISEKKLNAPNEIFNHVRQRLIEGLSSDGAKDGMDGILLRFDNTNNMLNYVAAQNKSILIRDNRIIDLKYDKIPVGLGENTNSFTLHTIQLEKNDTLFIYTDGYADQFGGEKGKKFKYKRLNELLLEHHKKSLAQQKEIIEKEFESWRGDLEQVDDVCLMGFRI